MPLHPRYIEPRLFAVAPTNHISIRCTPLEDEYWRLEVFTHPGDLTQGQTDAYERLTLDEVTDVVLSTLSPSAF